MIVAILLGITGTTISGLMLYAIEEGEGKGEAGEEFWEETHEVFANLTLLLVGIHVAGVLFSSYRERENLIKSMFTGQKPSEL